MHELVLTYDRLLRLKRYSSIVLRFLCDNYRVLLADNAAIDWQSYGAPVVNMNLVM